MSSKPDPREAYVSANARLRHVAPTKAVLDDLRFFGKRADEGRPITFNALQTWILEKHGVYAGRQRMATMATQAGIKPWWST